MIITINIKQEMNEQSDLLDQLLSLLSKVKWLKYSRMKIEALDPLTENIINLIPSRSKDQN